MISRIKFKFGHGPSTPPESIVTGPITVFVGPNNSGKSKVLAEIGRLCQSGTTDAAAVILAGLEFSSFQSDAAADQAIGAYRQEPNPGEAIAVDHVMIGARGERQQVPLTELRRYMLNPQENLNVFCSWFTRHATLLLDGKNRINLVGPQAAGDLQRPPLNSLQVLFTDNAKRLEVRRVIRDAFGVHFVVDPTEMGRLRIRLSVRPPSRESEERGWDSEAVRFHSAAQLIDIASDGVKAFAGIVTEVIAGDPRIVLIDEPEAFLHPALAQKLGLELSRAALASDKRVLVSTHSPTFVMGCIQSGAPVNIVRLTYRDGAATARVLPSAEILELMRNPLLRSTGVLSGLFYEFVVVTESDADRAFYQEVNERLLRLKPEWGISNCLFLNAQNKQTVHTIIRPLRKLGIPAVGIVDIDILKEGGTTWSNLMNGAFVPSISAIGLGNQRQAVKTAMDATGKDMKRDGGIAILAAQEAEAANNLLVQMAEYGLHVIPGGELESWLKHLAIPGKGPNWLIEMFQKMGEDQDAPTYVKPTSGDVWAFMGRVRGWLVDAQRKGIPV